MGDKIIAVLLIIAIGFWTFNNAVVCVVDHPNLWGAWLAVCCVTVGCLATASIIRDRL